jgi:hypothetical protein
MNRASSAAVDAGAQTQTGTTFHTLATQPLTR